MLKIFSFFYIDKIKNLLKNKSTINVLNISNKIKTTQTTLIDGRVKIIQPLEGYRTGIDTVFLAASLDILSFKKNKKYKILDLGCGVGTVSFCLFERMNRDNNSDNCFSKIDFYGLEIQEELVAIAKKNILLNKMENRLNIINGDIRNLPKEIEKNSFSHVLMNPPFYIMDSNNLSKNNIKKIANAEVFGELNDWVITSYKALKQKGYLLVIYPADRLHILISELISAKFCEIQIYPLWSKEGFDCKRIIIQARKSGKGADPKKSQTKLLSGLVIHENNGEYTEKTRSILYGESNFSPFIVNPKVI